MSYCYDNTIPLTILLLLLIITSTSFTVESDIYVQVLPVLKSGLTVFPQRLRSGKKTKAKSNKLLSLCLFISRSSLTCPHCLKQSNTFDPFLCISLPIPLRQTRWCITHSAWESDLEWKRMFLSRWHQFSRATDVYTLHQTFHYSQLGAPSLMKCLFSNVAVIAHNILCTMIISSHLLRIIAACAAF